MNYHFRLVKEKKVIVSSVCYLSPLQELLELAKELKKERYLGEVLFDLLCVNGNNPNRFVSMLFNGEEFERGSVKSLVKPSKLLLDTQDSFYKKHLSFITSSVLSTKQQNNYLP
ncbi:MAG: hypothetical protein GQ569_06280 [Methylococcaceae bacterium]|nr:hypothetical protein [Methylococcaceae bacterium]